MKEFYLNVPKDSNRLFCAQKIATQSKIMLLSVTRLWDETFCLTCFIIQLNLVLNEMFMYISYYNPPINFRVILLATLRHVVQIAGQLSCNNPRPIRYLSSDCFRRERNIVSTRISTFLFSYLTWKEIKLVLLSLAIVTLKSAVPESTKNYPG